MKTKLFIVMFMAVWGINAQISVTGIVKDSIGSPLEMANVIAINTQTKKLDSYGFTDAKGRYKLNLKKNANYNVKVSYIGMKTANITLQTQEINLKKDIQLSADESLDEVNITYKMPVQVKGDTIVYDADSFKSGTEKKLGDVLKKLPGVEVNDDGEIEVEGKTVKKVMIEGKDFFDGDSKLATKNIPANAIDKVEVLKNHSEVQQLSRVTDNEDNVVINLKLKEGKKRFWFGEVSAGVGPDERYITHPKLFYYSPKFSLNVISDFNNIGEIPFTWRDYFKFTGGFRNIGSGGTSLNLSNDLGFLITRNNRAKEIENKFGALNFSYSPKKTLDFSGFAIYSGSKTTIEENSIRNYINQDLVETTNNNTFQKNDLGLVKLSTSYKPNTNNQLDYDAFIKVSKLSQDQNVISNRVTNTSNESVPISELSEQTPFSLNQNLNYYYTLNENHIFSFEGQHLWQDEDPFYNTQLNQLSGAITNPLSLGTGPFNLNQNQRIKTNKLDAKADYFYVLNSKSNLNATFGTTLSSQQFNSNIYQILSGTQQDLNDIATKNDVEYSFSDFYTGLHYKFVTGIFTFNQGATLHTYSAKNTQLGSVVDNSFTKLLPDAYIKVNLKKSETLRLGYRMQVSFTDVTKFAEGYVLNNYNSLYSGNRDLENALSHNFSLTYSNFNMFNYTNIFANISYNKRIDAIKGITRQNGIDRVSSSVNSAFPDETISANGRFEKSFRKFKVSFGGNVSYSKLNNLFVNSQTQVTENRVSKSFNQSYRAKFSTNFRDAPNFDVGYNFSVNNYDQGNVNNTFTTHSPYVNFDAYFLKSFVFNTKYTYNNYRNQERTINNYSFWDADLTYQKKDSSWEYKVGVSNILNTTSLNQDNTLENVYNSTSSYFVQPRYVVFTVKYNL
ncbi:TonB-dependent receptor [Tenacibaculum holothuriorum]|uniref:TonB-dependent receptor n=1 Tax=Tenacibaculum holothuriorum TaxID=1635173 RepID=A0A1Y2PA16_9FLAO|nr:TonB-dependent receptor [Tenacibaculum holothuriorum]OSY86881.1 TonB-dependent receptor [Tenacibaculum holothuriorum]